MGAGFVENPKMDYAAPILYMPVPQTGHFPFIAGLPFFMVTLSGLSTSLLVRHLTQYIVAIDSSHLLSIMILRLICKIKARIVRIRLLVKSDFEKLESEAGDSKTTFACCEAILCAFVRRFDITTDATILCKPCH